MVQPRYATGSLDTGELCGLIPVINWGITLPSSWGLYLCSHSWVRFSENGTAFLSALVDTVDRTRFVVDHPDGRPSYLSH